MPGSTPSARASALASITRRPGRASSRMASGRPPSTGSARTAAAAAKRGTRRQPMRLTAATRLPMRAGVRVGGTVRWLPASRCPRAASVAARPPSARRRAPPRARGRPRCPRGGARRGRRGGWACRVPRAGGESRSPSGARGGPVRRRRRIRGQVEHYPGEAARAGEKLGRAAGVIEPTARAHPEQRAEHGAGGGGARGIERIGAVDERHQLAGRGRMGEQARDEAASPRGPGADDLAELASGKHLQQGGGGAPLETPPWRGQGLCRYGH